MGRARPRADLFAGTGVELRFEEGAVQFEFESAEAAAEEYSTKFGPIVMLREALEAEGRWEALVADLRAMWEEISVADGDGIAFDGEYMITLGTKG